MTLKELLVGFGTQVRSIWMIGLHAFAKRETRLYPEEPVSLPPRWPLWWRVATGVRQMVR